MYRRAQALLLGHAVVMAVVAIVVAVVYDKRLVDPDGSFLGPSWLRLPLLLFLAVALDLLPRTLWYSRLKPRLMPGLVRERLRTHWTRDRLTLVALGVICFYLVYVSYRNLKSFLPFVRSTKYDRELHMLDRFLLFGHDPALLLHGALGKTFAAYPLSYVYLWFLPLVPLAVTVWLVWSRNLSYGYWFVGSQCIAWTLGTASYYALPTLGPGLAYQWLYEGLAATPTEQLMTSLSYGRHSVLFGVSPGAVQSVAGFASLHCAITLLVALMVQYTVRSRVLHIVFWVNFVLTVTATLYFGWHYIADDIAGVAIAFTSFYFGGLAAGQTFKRGRAVAPLEQEQPAVEPVSTAAAVPAEG